MSNQIPVAMTFFAGNLFPAAAGGAATLLVEPVPDAFEGSSDALIDGGVFEALTEAAYTLLAFLLAGAVIHAMKQRSRRKAMKKATIQKSAGLGPLFANSTAQHPTSAGQPGAKTALPASHGRVTSGAATTCELAYRNNATSVAAPRAPSRGSEENDVLAAAVRVGRASELPRMMDAARARASARGADRAELEALVSQHVLSSLRACVARRCFQEALAAYDHSAEYVGGGCTNTWSLLLYCAVEAPDLGRCEALFDALLQSGQPSSNDFVNMVRYHAQQRIVANFKEMFGRLRSTGFELDPIARNRALSVCTLAKAPELAVILADAEITGVALDVVGYNTLMKCFSQSGQPRRCFELYEQMRNLDIVPSSMTFGILLDACVDAGEHESTRLVFNDLRASGVRLNVVHFTTFMKGLANSGQLKEATDILDEMLTSGETKPDLVTYSTLVKAHADRGNVIDAIRVLEKMIKQGVVPDAVILNIVLTGCCVKPMERAKILHVFHWLTQNGLRVTTTTLSILVKAFARNYAWDAALDLLEKAPARLQVWPEARLYGQLAQACARVGDAAKALETYALMVRASSSRGVAVDEASNARLLRLCSSCGASATASRIYEAVVAAGGLMEPEAVDVLLAGVA